MTLREFVYRPEILESEWFEIGGGKTYWDRNLGGSYEMTMEEVFRALNRIYRSYSNMGLEAKNLEEMKECPGITKEEHLFNIIDNCCWEWGRESLAEVVIYLDMEGL